MGSKTTPGRTRRLVMFAVLAMLVAIAAPLYALGGADKPIKKAEATLVDAAGNVVGNVKLDQHKDGVRITAKFDVLPAGFHGFHVHTTGVCTAPAFTSANGHLNPSVASHGSHAGDMPVLLVNADGSAEQSFETDRFTVDQLFDADGSAIVVHVGADNYANIPSRYTPAPDATTLNTGDAGARFACGVVELKKH